jgi:excisionase family DNA binding protein
MAHPENKPFLTIADVAAQLMVSSATVRLWCESGLIACETTLGGHRRFRQADIDALLASRAATDKTPAQGKAPSILIIDDDAEQVQTLADRLIRAAPNLTVHTASNGFSGGMKAAQLKPDVVLLDLMMPGMNGIDVCRMLRAEPQTRSIRVIACTGYANADQVEAIMAAGAEECLHKPIVLPQLLQLLGAVK